ncbi:MAG: sigma-70 family RNA polymerase sigma factor [Cyanobium sp.]|jgi:RNA polymerase sigma-B factor
MRDDTICASLPFPLSAGMLSGPSATEPPRSDRRPVRRGGATPADRDQRAELRRRNQRWLEAYARCRQAPEAISLRNRLVEHNLPLVVRVAASLQHGDGLPFEDRVQVGCLGLIRAIEAWDGRRGACLSSFAVPYIRGAIQREIRDRLALLRIPRPLWELRQRASALQEQQRRRNQPGLNPTQLAAALACSPELLEESLELSRRTTPRSLDAPLPGAEPGSPTNLLDLLADPASQPSRDPEAEPLSPDQPQRVWLRRQLLRLAPTDRALLEGRLLEGCSWPELARRAGVSPATARRRLQLLLRQLRQAAQAWQEADRSPAPGLAAV